MTDYFHPHLSREELLSLPTLGLAHVGDCIFELMARTYVLTHGGAANVKKIHLRTVAIVRAEAQASYAREMPALLGEDEHVVFLRGRNAKPKTLPKSASHEDYALATALEALFGWLYLQGDEARLNELFECCCAPHIASLFPETH